MPSLGTFEEIIEEEPEEEEKKEEEEKADEDEKDEQEDQEQEQELDDYEKLDPEIRKMIDAKIKETGEIMTREIEDRKKYLDEKLDDILNPKKGKKK